MKAEKISKGEKKLKSLEDSSKPIKKDKKKKAEIKQEIVSNEESFPKKIKKDFKQKSFDKTDKTKPEKKWNNSNNEINNEKTNWIQFKKEKKQLKLKRKEGRYKNLTTLIHEAKVIYEKLKCRKTENKSELAEKLFNMLKKEDCIQKFVLAHDTSRIIQCLLKCASPKIREELSEDLLPVSVTMMQSRYAHFCILRMVKYGSNETKSKLVDSLYGSVIKLCSHNIAGKIMDQIYFDKASKKQQNYLRQEFYADIFAKSKEPKVKTLKDTYEIIQTSKEFVLDGVKNKLIHLINKNALDNSLVHQIIYEYIEECTEGKNKEGCEEFLKMCIPLTPHLLTTKNGTKVATHIFWTSQAKERRAILKAIKEHLLKIFTHEYGHQFILVILNSLDDTKAIKKSIFDPMISDFNEIIQNQYGRRVLQWIISPADKEAFHPGLISFLDSGLVHSKKDKIVRRQEIYDQIEEPLCEKVKENPKLWVSNGNIGFVLASFCKHITPQRAQEIYECLAKEITSIEWKMEESNELGIEDSGMHHALKRIFKNDQQRLQKNEPTFAEELLKNINNEVLELWLPKNRGCFVLILLFEALNESRQGDFKKILKPFSKNLEESSHAGAKILLTKIKGN